MSTPKFPNVKVQLVGQDGNAFFIMGRVIQAMKRAGISKEDQEAYKKEATSGDYNHLLATTMATVSCDDPDEFGFEEEDDEVDDEDLE